MVANAVELTVEQAWYLAELTGSGSFPWVLAITPPYSEPSAGAAFAADRTAELSELGVLSGNGSVNPAVVRWIRSTCLARQWLELRVVSPGGDMLRGVVGRRGERSDGKTAQGERSDGKTAQGERSDGIVVVALRSGGLVTFTEVDLADPRDVVPVVTAGLQGRRPADFDEFTLPMRAGARADEKLRGGADLAEVVAHLGIPASARPVVEAVFTGPRSYVEIVAGEHRDGYRVSTEVGVSVVDCGAGRILVHPQRAFDGEWVSTFTPGAAPAIAAAVDRLTASLPDGSWFADARSARLSAAPSDRDFEQRTENRCPTTL
ncbi:secretion protein EspG [Mycolicibacterium canariasense]|uniref:Secretion protein EspG n=1 Tax=Mycolicibacterium canariasense TaxID=228230 RepID=A0A100WD56_MYCCR|nr:ESX secretion-associated protein EspG [Mycolicibacterium canariasense]MCV7209974.1 ESX secretion-associated protein EspG [Mycolicibacterium canariasense]ORV05239.1 secretion protein EspG [Mycolicibacterium canariasense]GAS96344.1 secretion protein EspG [Mycolicibacterium canariasense]